MADEIDEQKDISQKIDALEKETQAPDFLVSPYAQDVLKELHELKEKKAQEENEKSVLPKKDIFLVITRDSSIFNSTRPAGKLIGDISSIVPELHIIYIGRKKEISNTFGDNTFIYIAPYIPFLSFLTVYKVILSEVVWKRRFVPTVVLSIGDQVVLAKLFARKYSRPLYVFYSYMKVLGKGSISMTTLTRLYPQKIIVPNEYVKKAIENNYGYKAKYTNIKILNEYVEIPELEVIFDEKRIVEEANSRNNTFNMIVFPRQANLVSFFKLKNIGRELSHSIKKFEFTIVVKRGHYIYAKILRFLCMLPGTIVKEDKESISLFHTARLMLYFDAPHIAYDPVFYSLISGCPVISSGDEYSKIILFNSGFEEFTHVGRHSNSFAVAIKKLVNDIYLYEKYKMNCIGFAKSAFTHDHSAYMQELRESLKVGV